MKRIEHVKLRLHDAVKDPGSYIDIGHLLSEEEAAQIKIPDYLDKKAELPATEKFNIGNFECDQKEPISI